MDGGAQAADWVTIDEREPLRSSEVGLNRLAVEP